MTLRLWKHFSRRFASTIALHIDLRWCAIGVSWWRTESGIVHVHAGVPVLQLHVTIASDKAFRAEARRKLLTLAPSVTRQRIRALGRKLEKAERAS